TGEALLDDPHITPALFTDDRFDFATWKERVKQDPTVYGILVGKQFDWAAVVRFLSPGYDEITEFRRTVEFLEGRAVPWWEWLWKTDIFPKEPQIMVGGWCIGRGLIDQGLLVDTIMLVILGTVLALPVFIAAFGSLSNALLGVLCVILPSLLWARGSIGLLELAGVEVRERVYLLLVYANCVVQGVSFVLHKFSAFREASMSNREEAWRSAQVVDPLIGATAIIAVLGFGSLWWSFEVLTIRELGLLSALGVTYVYFLAVIILPALHMLFGRDDTRQETEEGKLGRIFSALLEKLVEGCAWLVTRFPSRPTAWVAGGATVFLLLTATLLIYPGHRLITHTRPLEFVEDTLVHKTALFLNRPQNVGFDFLELLAEPTNGADSGLHDPDFLQRVWAYQQDLKRLPGVREVSSVLNTLHRIA
ncbi:MAG: MMPL family transporter, partial [Candidatus Binatia bacterium]